MTACKRQPIAGESLGGQCPDCGHATVVHVGTNECPVCRLVEMSSPEYWRREARIHGRTLL